MAGGQRHAARYRIRVSLTLVPLLLDLDLLGKVLVLLPLDVVPDGLVVDKVSTVSDLLLVEVGLCELGIIKELVLAESEVELEAWSIALGVRQSDVFELLQDL